jgi:chloride channel protein, CIC family
VRRSHLVLVIAAVTGAIVGLCVAGFVQLTDDVVLDAVLDAPGWVRVAAPGAGLVLAALSVRFLTDDRGTATADEYVASFHDRHRSLSLRRVPGRLLAGVATIGLGGAMGLEGPSIYLGSAVGTAIQRRLHRVFAMDEAKVLLVAGAAAGVAAVFRAPATGVVFALEVPYTDDIARRALLPSLVAAATSYLAFVAVLGTRPLFQVLGTSSGFNLAELGGALLVGVLCGALARAFSVVVATAKRMTAHPALVRIPIAAAVLGILAVITTHVYGEPLSLGPGYGVFEWLADPGRTLPLIALLFAVRFLAVSSVLGAGGVGGLFIPLALLGALVGSFVAHLIGDTTTMFPVVGLAAFLGAGYRAPLASVMFVAETTGQATFVVPALLAAAVSQLLMGSASVSKAQQTGRAGHLERRLRLPISAALDTEVMTVPPDATVAELVWTHVLGRRERTVPVVDADGHFVGIAGLESVGALERERWEGTRVADIVAVDTPVGSPAWSLRDAVRAMEGAGVDALAVVDGDGRFVGLVRTDDVVKLEEILDETGSG